MDKLYIRCRECDGSGLGTAGPDAICCGTCHGEGYTSVGFTYKDVLQLSDERDRFRSEVAELYATLLRVGHLPGRERKASDA
jgi:hypothetical protein